MANEIYTTSSANFAVPARVSGPTCYTGFEIDRTADWSHPYRPSIQSAAISTSTSRVVFDFGAATSLVAIYAEVNLASVKFQSSSDGSSWSDNPSGAQTVSQNLDSRRYKILATPTAFNSRYLGMLAATTTTTDGSGAMKAKMVGIKSWDDGGWTQNSGFPLGRDIVTPSREDQQYGDKIAIGNQYAQLSLASSLMKTAMTSTILRIAGYGATPFLFYRNRSDTSESYICRLVGDRAGYSEPGPNHFSFGPLVLRELT